MFSNMLLRRIATSRTICLKKCISLEVMFAHSFIMNKSNFLQISAISKATKMFSNRVRVSTEYNFPIHCKQEQTNSSDSFSEVVLRLKKDVQSTNRVTFKDLETLLHMIRKDGIPPSSNYDILLLECCSDCLPDVHPLSRVAFVHSIWETLKGLGTVFTSEHYCALLKNYAVNNCRISAEEFLNDLKGVVPDKRIYEHLLYCVCLNGDIKDASFVLKGMKDNDIPINEISFNSLILGHARAGDIQTSLSLLNTMQAAKLEPSASTYTILLQSFGEIGNFKEMKTLYERKVYGQFSLSDSQVLKICESLVVFDHHNLISKFLELIPDDSRRLTLDACNTILSLINLKKEEGALTLLLNLSSTEANVNLQKNKYVFFIHELCKADSDPSCIIKLCNVLEEKEIFPRALLEAANSSIDLMKTNLTCNIFHALVQKGVSLRPHYFWPIFKQRAISTGESGILATLKDMQDLNVPPDFHTMVDYILPHILSPDPQSLIQKLKKYDISVSKSLSPIAAALVNSRKIRELQNLCEQYPTQIEFNKLLTPLVEYYIAKRNVKSIIQIFSLVCKYTSDDIAGQFLLELLTIKQTRLHKQDLRNILKEYLKAAICISPFSSEIIAQHFKNGSSEDNFSERDIKILEKITVSDKRIRPSELFEDHIPHPRAMNLEELECHLVELKAKSMNTRGVLRRLFLLHTQKGNVRRVQEIKKELEEAGFKFTPGMLSNLFGMYVQEKNIDSAERCLSEILNNHPSFVMDEYKIIDYATLLVSEGKYRSAVAVLEKRAGDGNICGGNAVSLNCWKLLSAIAMRGEPEQTKHMLHLLENLGYCVISNTLLGPLVRAHLQRGDTDGAVRQYIEFCDTYKMTPLQQELFDYLVSNSKDSSSDVQKLQEVMRATSLVYGECSTDTTYAIALAKAEKKAELLKFFQEKRGNLNNAILMNRCEKLAKEGNFAALSVLIDLLHVLPDFNAMILYDMMLQICDTNGDYKMALQMWTKIQEKNLVPSQKFLHSLESLLKRHNQQVPFVVS